MKCGPGSDWIARRRPRIGGEVPDPLLPIPLFPPPPSPSLTFTEGQNLPSLAWRSEAAGRMMTVRSMVPEAIYFPPRTSSTPLYSSLLPSLSPCSLFRRSVGRLLSASSFLPYYDPLSAAAGDPSKDRLWSWSPSPWGLQNCLQNCLWK